MLQSRLSGLLVNALYSPPCAADRALKYLRPSHSLTDLAVWAQGLVPRSSPLAARCGQQTLSPDECVAVQAGVAAR